MCRHPHAVAGYGAESSARVHKSFFYGSKHIDKYVPLTDPNAPVAKMSAKQAEWAAEAAPGNALSMYTTTHAASFRAN